MTTQQPVLQRDALDIVFANRNRAYGAYQLRREYPTTLGRALGIGLLLIGLMVLVPRIFAAFSAVVPEEPVNDVVVSTTVINIEKPPVPPAVVTPPPPPKPSIAFPPPVVSPDEMSRKKNLWTSSPCWRTPVTWAVKPLKGPVEGPPSLDPPSTGLGVLETPAPADNEPVEPFLLNRMPGFPGGEAEMFKWIYKHINYPEMAKEAGTQGQVVLMFVVGKDGGITDITVVKTPAGGGILGKEAMRVVQSMPRWSPGEANGHPVKVRFTLPIRFSLQ